MHYTSRILAYSTPDIYNEEFFAGINGVTNALDNVKARTFVL